VIFIKSIAIVNGSKKFDGIFMGMFATREALKELDYKVNWYQCVDKSHLNDYYLDENVVLGIKLPLNDIEMGINRLFVFPRKLKNLKEDIIFISDPTLLKISENYNDTIIKIHDIRPLTKYSDKIFTKMIFSYLLPKLKYVRLIVVTTNHMGEELSKMGYEIEKIRVVREIPLIKPNREHYIKSLNRIQNKKELNILYIATDRPYKNISFFLNLANEIKKIKINYDFKFHLVSNLKDKNREIISRMELKNLKVYSNVKNIEDIYELSDVLVYPSLYEGFGRPIIEAMAFGIPVIANNIQPFIEIVGDHGKLINVENTKKWIDALISLTDEETYRKYSKLSIERAEYYSLENMKIDLKNSLKGF
jgi:glycosyltransferase involved in cell wall biosynthesis